MSKLILLKSFYHKHDAQIVMGLLEDSGIEAILQSDDAGGFRHHLTLGAGNNRVMIQEKDAQKALEIIKTLEDSFSEEELKQIEEIAVGEKEVDLSKPKKKLNNNYSILIPVIIGIVFIVSYVFQEGRKNKYDYGNYSNNIECKLVDTRIDTHSVCTEYYINKKVRSIVSYKEGQIQGVVKEFYTSGQVRSEWMNTNNQLNGPYKHYYDNGQLMAEGNFLNNKLEGQQKEYFKTSELKRVIHYKDGEVHGNLKTYYKSGNIMEDLEIRNGVRFDTSGNYYEGPERTYYENGSLWEEWNYKKGRLEGLSKSYFENSNLNAEVRYKQGKSNGQSKIYYENGNIEAALMYDMDELVSIKEYNKEGDLTFQAEYR